mmetsp:Transcript_17004/g.30511  ORF Transcript_17004/g.30511 Transcript_17004/m.30511 type:complete len:124 (+) Transcript_17004:341-712(+)
MALRELYEDNIVECIPIPCFIVPIKIGVDTLPDSSFRNCLMERTIAITIIITTTKVKLEERNTNIKNRGTSTVTAISVTAIMHTHRKNPLPRLLQYKAKGNAGTSVDETWVCHAAMLMLLPYE